MKQCSALVLCLVLTALWSSRARAAEPECNGERAWVAVVGDVRPALAEAVRSDLRAGLAPSSIDVCAEGAAASSEPLARVTIKQVDEAGARFSLDVTDSVTKKRVGRDLSLEKLPADGRPLALAVAAEELLRASWAELALRGVHSPQTAAPPEVRAVVEKSEPPPEPRRYPALGARLAFEHFLGGQTHYGADLFGAVPLGRVAGAFIAAGARRALSEQAPHGSIAASALSAELGLSLTFFHQNAFELGAFVSGRLLRLSFEPAAEAGFVENQHSGLAVTSRVGLALSFGRPGLLRSYSALGAGLPLRSYSAADSGGTITGASQLELFASTGLALELP